MKNTISRMFMTVKDHEVEMNTRLLKAHLDSIKGSLYEIYNLKKKRVGNTLVHNIWREVDLEKAWPSSQDLVLETYQLLTVMSERLKISPQQMESSDGFRSMIEGFIQQINAINDQLLSGQNTFLLKKEEIELIDLRIMAIQGAINRLHKHILVDFDFTATQAEQTMQTAYRKHAKRNLILPAPC